ncbi:MAG: hypothetical protein KDI82_10095 [Gammaproteobacteria bacterium]|nr:hypothetical protein [Gammaproteobacteria bacterium]
MAPIGQSGRYRPVAGFLVALLVCLFSARVAGEGPVGLVDVDTITIMPVAFPADPALVERDEPLTGLYGELDEYIYKALLRNLALKGYVLERPRNWQRPDDWHVDALAVLSPAELAARLPASATFAALLFVERVATTSRSGVADAGASATVSAMIVHRPTATRVWDGAQTGVFQEGLGQLLLYGPLVMLLTPDKHAAVERAFGRLFAALPEKRY